MQKKGLGNQETSSPFPPFSLLNVGINEAENGGKSCSLRGTDKGQIWMRRRLKIERKVQFREGKIHIWGTENDD